MKEACHLKRTKTLLNAVGKDGFDDEIAIT
jgi:hypothetical protein